jgi:hypothetical protein
MDLARAHGMEREFDKHGKEAVNRCRSGKNFGNEA